MKTAKSIFLSLVLLIMVFIVHGLSSADELVVTETGSVGIGASSPTALLHVASSNDTYLAKFEDSSAGENRLVIKRGGNVGIGTTSPLAGLHIENSGSEAKRSIRLAYDETYYGLIKQRGAGGIAIDAVGGQAIDFQGGGTSKMYIAATGNVGIGTTNPSNKLTVSTNTSLDGLYLLNNVKWMKIMPGTLTNGSYNGLSQEGDNGIIFSGGTQDSGNFVIGPWASGAKGIKIASNGNVGINKVPEVSYVLDVDGVIRAGSWTSNSDLRWKENIEPINDALDRVGHLRGVSYEWIDKSRGQGPQIGVIAQEVEEIFPEVVHTDSEGYKSVEYCKLVAPLIEAVKELNNQNEKLQVENTNLKNEIAALRDDVKERLAVIEAAMANRK